MKKYFSESEAVIDLHERGFTEDFHLFGNNLLWIQQQIFLTEKDFSIVECHSFINLLGKKTIIFGVIASTVYVWGILINHCISDADKIPISSHSTLKKMSLHALNSEGNYM